MFITDFVPARTQENRLNNRLVFRAASAGANVLIPGGGRTVTNEPIRQAIGAFAIQPSFLAAIAALLPSGDGRTDARVVACGRAVIGSGGSGLRPFKTRTHYE
jgi:hypothetical protein